ncbi:MAG: chloride channel protein [Candidatus Nezhaarchaeales archaeon]
MNKVMVKEIFKWALLSVSAGLMGGFASIIFNYVLDSLIHIIDSFREGFFAWWLIPAFGGLIVGVIHYTLDRDAFNIPCATDAMVEAVNFKYGKVKPIVPFLRVITAPITIATGGSSGRECPLAYIGCGWASLLSDIIKKFEPLRKLKQGFSSLDSRTLGLCGAAAALAGIFRAPLGAAVFAVEVLYRKDIEINRILPVTISSVIGYFLFISVYGADPLMVLPVMEPLSIIELGLCALIGVIAGLVAVLWVKTFITVHEVFKHSALPLWVKPALGGFLEGLILLWLPQVWGMGYEYIQMAIQGQILFWVMFALIFAKILATAFSIGSGGAGGVLIPSMYIGAMLGGVLSIAFHSLNPSVFTHHAAYVGVAMSALYAAAGKVPLSAALLLSEFTHNFWLVIPMLIANTIAYLLSGLHTIYPSQILRRERAPLRNTLIGLSILLLIALIYFYFGSVL